MISKVEACVSDAIHKLGFPSVPYQIQVPGKPGLGDFATNAALLLTRQMKRPPMEIAHQLAQTILENDDGFFYSIEPAPPGFINFKINQKYVYKGLKTILKDGTHFGRQSVGKGKKALVEFVSANPTGPLTVAHGRGAVLGDCISNILEWNGYEVHREYYFNNAGRQMKILGESVYIRYQNLCGEKVEFPDDYYQGEYITEIATHIFSKFSDTLAHQPESSVFRQSAEEIIFQDIKQTLESIQLVFDHFYNEKTLYDSGQIQAVVDELNQKGLIYENDGATWFKGTELGRDVDKVLIKGTGEPTYRLPDMAYHKDKYDRGFDRMIDVFGADHADTFPDILAALKTLGYDLEKIQVIIHQFVTIIQDGEQVKMSTRKANYISLDDLISQVGADVVRYFFIMRGMNTHLNFDLKLATDRSDENPVFYLQYAHARVCNILLRAKANEIVFDPDAELGLLVEDIELQLIRKLLEFPLIIQRANVNLEPQGIANYLHDTAGIFHRFYAHHRVISENNELTAARLVLTEAFRIVISNGLTLLGLTAPERM